MATTTPAVPRNIESSVGDAHHIAILMQRIETARGLIGQFEQLNSHKEFKSILKDYEISIFKAVWEIEHSDALARLLTIQCQFLSAAQDAAAGSAS